jgi:polyvinyl alcohol dehydrogenase (cytochrome)
MDGAASGGRQQMSRLTVRALLGIAAVVAVPALASAQPGSAMSLFQERCVTCHVATPPPDSRAPSLESLRNLSPETILVAITTGPMAPNSTGLTDPQRRAIAEYVGGRGIGASEKTSASVMTNQCRPEKMGDIAKMPRWNGWGADVENSRLQPSKAAGLKPDDVPRLKLKWAFGVPNATAMYAQPAIAGGRLFVGSDNAVVYSINAQSGCVYWSFQAGAAIRTAMSVGQVTGQAGARYAVYFGDLNGAVYAVNAETGTLLWKQQADSHSLARITGAPTLHRGRLYVPVTGYEEAVAANPTYECCTFQGAVVAYDANTGAQVWRASTIAAPLTRTRKTSLGTQLWGPAGAGVWSAPTIDVRTNSLYVATGDAFTAPAAPTSDAIVAFDLDTGRQKWARQMTPDDAYIYGCGGARQSETCPATQGPDFDFGASPILRTLPNGRRVLTAGQKSGVAWGLDPDKEGAVLWEHRIGKGSVTGGIEWGGAADEQVVYFTNNDSRLGPGEAGGLAAIRLATGERLWLTKPPVSPACQQAAAARGGRGGRGGGFGCSPGQPAAPTLIPGVVFAASMDGVIRAYDTRDGRVIWEIDTARPFPTINGVEGKGGAINGPGPVIVDGILYVTSGYGTIGGVAGNVLLAFARE